MKLLDSFPLRFPTNTHTEIKCPAYTEFPTGVEGGFGSDPCKPAPDFQLSSPTDPSCSLKCKAGYEQKNGGTGVSMLQCDKDGKLSGDLTCIGRYISMPATFDTVTL